MQTKVVKVDPANVDVAQIKEAAGLVDAGGLVAFPTETVYGIGCRVNVQSLSKLGEVKGRDPEKYYTLHISDEREVKKYVPTVGIRAEKLIERAWPGPLTIVFELNAEELSKQRDSVEKDIFESLYKDDSIGIRWPDNPIASMLLRETDSAVVAPSANITGQRPAVDAEEVLAQFSGQIELVLDGGPCEYKRSSTVVKIGKKGLQMLRSGVYSEPDLQAMSEVRFLFVCTGNTCRSPMAEGMFRKYLVEKLGCEIDQVEKIGYKTSSAGTMGMVDAPASPEAIAACAVKGIDIRAHKSRTLSEQLVTKSDFIFAMSGMHRERVMALSGEAANRCVLLAENKEIADPIGQPQQVYDYCAELIEKAVRKRIGELVL